MLAATLTYLRAGLSVIPVHPGDKRPCIAWKEFQTRLPAEADVQTWWTRWPAAGVAVVCGAVSGLVVVDFDPRNGEALTALKGRLVATPTAETGGGGQHDYFALNPGERIRKLPNLLPGADLQAEASYVIAPPSLHPSGRRYRWLPGLALGEVPLAPLPQVIRQLIMLRQLPKAESVRKTRKLAGTALTVEQVLSALQGVKRSGRGWVALCPAHNDQQQSLSIAVDGGKVLFHCFAGCSFFEILTALRLKAA